MPRGRTDHDLATALKTIMQGNPTLTAYRIHIEITHHPERYEAPENFSVTAVHNAIAGKPISPRTRDVLYTYVRTIDTALLPMEPKIADLDLGTFFYTRGPKLQKAGVAIEGEFQTYARSTTAEGYLRLGHVSFHYDCRKWRIRMRETQYRPAIAGHPEATMRWEGFAAQRMDYYFALLRTTADAQDATPLYYALRPLLRDPNSGRIQTMMGFAMHFEAERGCFMYPSIYFERKNGGEIVLDFMPMSDLDNGAVRVSLGLGEKLRRVRRRASHVPALT